MCRAESVLFALAESRLRMASESRRLSILTAQEVDDLYALPRFTEDDRQLYFDLSPAERELVDGVFTLSVAVHMILQLGYFKAKRQFFVYRARFGHGGRRAHSSTVFPGERNRGNQVALQIEPSRATAVILKLFDLPASAMPPRRRNLKRRRSAWRCCRLSRCSSCGKSCNT